MKLKELLAHSENRTGSLININANHPAFFVSESLELAPEQVVHRGSYCEFAKRFSRGMSSSCVSNKGKSQEIAKNGLNFHGTCPFGIWEMAQPLIYDGDLAATVYLGHFSSEKLNLSIGKGTFTQPLPPTAPKNLEELLQCASFISEFIRIELDFWKASGGGRGKQMSHGFYKEFFRSFIEQNYRENIQLLDMSSALEISPNHLSYLLKKILGKSFRQLLSEKRLQVACTYLEFELSKSVTDIAHLCGFRDSNYFSTTFKKHLGISPKVFRNKRKEPNSRSS